MVQIAVSPKFIGQLKDICRYIAENRSFEVALQFYDDVIEEIDELETFPRRWKRVHFRDIKGEFRRILFGVYHIYFEIEGKKITIHAIVDGRRRPPLFTPN